MTSGGPTGPGRASRLWLVHTASAGARSAPRSRTYCPADRERPVASTANAVVTEPAMMRVEIPGKIARHLLDHNDLGETERHALRQGHTGAPRAGLQPARHCRAARAPRVAGAAAPMGADGAARKAYRIYADRLTAAAILTDPAR